MWCDGIRLASQLSRRTLSNIVGARLTNHRTASQSAASLVGNGNRKSKIRGTQVKVLRHDRIIIPLFVGPIFSIMEGVFIQRKESTRLISAVSKATPCASAPTAIIDGDWYEVLAFSTADAAASPLNLLRLLFALLVSEFGDILRLDVSLPSFHKK